MSELDKGKTLTNELIVDICGKKIEKGDCGYRYKEKAVTCNCRSDLYTQAITALRKAKLEAL